MTIKKFRDENFFLSNFYPIGIKMEGITYPTLEHAYQASKTLDKDERLMILFANTPGKAKRLGKEVKIRKDWETTKVDVMKKLLKQKFSNPELKKILMETGDEKIIEGNEWGDTFWGVCNGKGFNILGKLLMEIRDNIRKEKQDD